ncbi:MAG: repressor LexA [Planctomycetes bacterium]|nr:repressor LexA [Planctomycetota bacterium]
MEPLTAKQRQVLEFVAGRLAEHRPPSQREIADHFGLAQNAAYQLVGYLRKKGYLVETGGHRGLRLSREYLEERREPQGLPIIGRVAAGTPILAEENVEGYVSVEKLFGEGEGTFALRVAGDSMVDEGIMDGDLVVVKAGSTIEDGQIAVVLLDDEATVKRVFLQPDRIALKPANRRAGYKTRYVRQFDKDVRVLGRVVGCIRTSVK